MKSLKERKGWKIILALILVIIISLCITVLVVRTVTNRERKISSEHLEEAEKAGYLDTIRFCERKANVIIDGIEYEHYEAQQFITIGSNPPESILIKSGSSYKDGTDGKAKNLVIYCERKAHMDEGTIVEPYSIYRSKVKLFYGIQPLLYMIIALIMLITIFIAYFIVYFVKKKNYKQSLKEVNEEITE